MRSMRRTVTSAPKIYLSWGATWKGAMRIGTAIGGCYPNPGVLKLSPVGLCCSDTACNAVAILSRTRSRAVGMRSSFLRRAFIGLQTRSQDGG